ncbi:MAG TPA: tripartite tricarboxylate transporter substrate binding protein [Ramlibacter sp.]|nr:tripartite tricarboxylate transporter substrate binding protein [Ramlibacter sp.]
MIDPSAAGGRRAFLAALAATLSGPALAQPAYPSRPVRIVVPWAPGGLVDTGGRVVADAIGKGLGQAGVVENVPGAAGTLGADQVAKAAPDGHVLLMGTSSLAIDVAGSRKTAYDLQRDLLPVALVADTQSVVVVPPASPIQSLADLIAAAKAKPGELAYGTPGIGSPAHLFTELFCQMAQVKLLHVPYNRTPAINDLMGGRLAVMFATAPASLNHIRNKLLRPLAVTGTRRLASLPEVPTVAQAGLAGYQAGQWLGVFAPSATPAAVVQRLNAEITKAVSAPAVAQSLEERGLEPRTASSAEFTRIVADEITKWTTVMRTGAIRLE